MKKPDTTTTTMSIALPQQMADWIDREAAKRYPVNNGGGNRSMLLREILTREMAKGKNG